MTVRPGPGDIAQQAQRRLEIAGSHGASRSTIVNDSAMWGGTFHSIATRMLRIYGQLVGLDPNFTIHDRSDSEDLLDVVRTELGLAKADRRFPKKGTCLVIYSHCVNSQRPLEDLLHEAYPWCKDFAAELKRLFQSYVDRKEQESVLDYDDLLVFWHALLSDPAAGEKARSRFDCVLVSCTLSVFRRNTSTLIGAARAISSATPSSAVFCRLA